MTKVSVTGAIATADVGEYVKIPLQTQISFQFTNSRKQAQEKKTPRRQRSLLFSIIIERSVRFQREVQLFLLLLY
jgi:hypothetical protein